MKALLNRMDLRQKFALLALVGAAMVAAPTVLYMVEAQKSIAVARREAEGIGPARAAQRVVQLVQQHRGLSNIVLSGEAGMAQERAARQRDVNDAMRNMGAIIGGVNDSVMLADWQHAAESWRQLSLQVEGGKIAPAGSFAAHTQLVTSLIRLNERVIDHYGLRLDPEPDTYFLIDAVLVRAVVLRETLAQIRGKGAGLLVDGEASLEARFSLNTLSGLARDYFDNIDHVLALSMYQNIGLRDKLKVAAQLSRAKGMQALNLTHRAIVEAGPRELSAREYYSQLTEAIDAQYVFSAQSLDALDVLLTQRADRVSAVNAWLLSLIGLLALASGWLVLTIIGSVVRPLLAAHDAALQMASGAERRIGVADAIAGGDLDRELETAPALALPKHGLPGDETGRLVASLDRLGEVQQRFDHAFRAMAQALRASRANTEQRDWVKSGQNELNDRLRGEFDAGVIAAAVLEYLVPRLGGVLGACYLQVGGGSLVLAAGYGLPPGFSLPQHLELGERLLGQALVQRRLLLVEQLPAGYLPLHSVLGMIEPGCLALLPLLHGELVVGVLEIGSLQRLGEREYALLDAVAASIAITLAAAQSRERARALLLETQQQSEELRVQQEELQQSNEELEQRADLLEQQREQIRRKNEELARTSQELWAKAQQLQQTSTYKSEFMANMSHELRTPLNSMLILSAMLKENRDGALGPKQVEYAATILAAGRDLLALINDILDLAKVEAGQVDLHIEPVEPAGLCRALRALLQESAAQKGLRLEVRCGDDVPAQVPLDAQRVQQVLRNLLANAIKFTERGMVDLDVRLARHDNPLGVPALAFAVRDTGIGIPQDKHEQVFEAFRQADGSISRRFGGTGLGLSISRQLARMMGGDIGLHSAQGAGSIFTFYLPLQPGQGAPAMARPPAQPEVRMAGASSGLAGKTVLVADDDQRNLYSLTELLDEFGLRTVPAANGLEALAQLESRDDIAAVLMDVMMPELDGYETMRRMRADQRWQALPIIAMTARAMPGDEKKCFAAGASDYIAKPVYKERLLALLCVWVGTR